LYSLKDFEGPLDLLLHLIQKAKINIYDIPIAEVTEQYLKYLDENREISLSNLTQFYAMAAHLIYMKSRLLLPSDELDEIDKEFLEMRSLLVERLLDYQKFKRYSLLLERSNKEGSIYLNRKKTKFSLPFKDEELFEEKSGWTLLNYFTKLLKAITVEQVFNVYEEVTTKQKLTLMAELFEKKRLISFEELIVNFDSPLDIICSFFAILEAAKFGMIRLRQSFNSEDIIIEQIDALNVQLIEESGDLDDDVQMKTIIDAEKQEIDVEEQIIIELDNEEQ